MQKQKKKPFKPSLEQVKSFQGAFDYFNGTLFQGSLPQVILNFSRSGSKTIAFYAPNRWEKSKGEKANQKPLDEISLNPRYLGRTLEQIFSSLVHEQCHLWQFTHGRKIPRRAYHNREWAEKMKEVGLQPDDGTGKETGQSVSHRIMEGGAFQLAFKKMPARIQLPWRVFIEGRIDDDNPTPKPKKKSSKVKYTCPGCGANVWGKGGLAVICAECTELFQCDEKV